METAQMPSLERSWQERIDDLLDIRTLEANWDGQGAEAPPCALVDTAIRFALSFRDQGLAPADFAIAGGNGTIFFEWHNPQGYLELEITAPNRAEGRFVRVGTDAAECFTLSTRR